MELDSPESPGEISWREVELDSQDSPGENMSREVELDSTTRDQEEGGGAGLHHERSRGGRWSWALKRVLERSTAGRWSWALIAGWIVLLLSCPSTVVSLTLSL